MIREAHTCLISGHFGVGKIVAQLQKFCYWPQMNDSVSKYVKVCFMCAIINPSNRKLGLYTPLLVTSRPWKSVSMDFGGGLPISRKRHDYLYFVVERISKMCILIPYKKKIIVELTADLFFQTILDYLLLLYITEIPSSLGNFGHIYGNLCTQS